MKTSAVNETESIGSCFELGLPAESTPRKAKLAFEGLKHPPPRQAFLHHPLAELARNVSDITLLPFFRALEERLCSLRRLAFEGLA